MNWLRLHHSVLGNPKVQKLPDNEFKAWVNMLLVASMREPRGSLPPVEELAFSLRLRAPFVARLMVKMERSNLVEVLDGVRFMNDWDHHQPPSDDVAQRVKKHREQKRNVTGNVTETVQIENRADRDTEEEKTPTESKRSASPKNGSATAHGSRFSLESLPEEWAAYCAADLKWAAETTAGTFANFSDYWNSKAGAGARKTNWLATWRIWCRNEEKNNAAHAAVLQMRPQERAGSARDTGPTQRAIDEGNRRMAKNGRLY